MAADEIQTHKTGTEYRLIVEHSIRAFNEAVSTALGEGWELYGSPTVRERSLEESGGPKARSQRYLLAQAVIRKLSVSGAPTTAKIDIPEQMSLQEWEKQYGKKDD